MSVRPRIREIGKEDADRILSEPRRRFVLAACWTFRAIQHATFNDFYEDSRGKTGIRLRKRPVHRGGPAFLGIRSRDNKLFLVPDILLVE